MKSKDTITERILSPDEYAIEMMLYKASEEKVKKVRTYCEDIGLVNPAENNA